MADRFELEQQILACWHVTDDIKSFLENAATEEDFEALVRYYSFKFERLWETFETMVRERKIT